MLTISWHITRARRQLLRRLRYAWRRNKFVQAKPSSQNVTVRIYVYKTGNHLSHRN